MIGIVLITVGIAVLGIHGDGYRTAAVESDEFGTCYDYSEDAAPVRVDCQIKIVEQVVFIGIVVALVGSGIGALIKGITGDWDSRVRPGEMVGPGRRGNAGGDDTNGGGSGAGSGERRGVG